MAFPRHRRRYNEHNHNGGVNRDNNIHHERNWHRQHRQHHQHHRHHQHHQHNDPNATECCQKLPARAPGGRFRLHTFGRFRGRSLWTWREWSRDRGPTPMSRKAAELRGSRQLCTCHRQMRNLAMHHSRAAQDVSGAWRRSVRVPRKHRTGGLETALRHGRGERRNGGHGGVLCPRSALLFDRSEARAVHTKSRVQWTLRQGNSWRASGGGDAEVGRLGAL
mmetsp:Transcript_65636/g.143971  ORF Transcript_65636/g.143971 Transcript_65636/m.143971 type:complete len:221 (+) Transcript_65636:345-1007(+)